MKDKKRHVFFVDDEKEIRKVISQKLERKGIKITCFSNAYDCLKQLQVEIPDLLITDLKMPKMDGITLLSETKRLVPWLPVAVITGYGDIPLAVQAVKQGAYDFIEKPFERKKLLNIIESALSKSRYCPGYHGKALTEAEKNIFNLLLEGYTNKQIAKILHRSVRTIEVHRSHIMKKFDVNNVVELVRIASEMGLLKQDTA